jgi:hypothetical protein
MILSQAFRALLVSLLVLATQSVFAQGSTVLTVSGPDGRTINYDLAALEALDSTTIETHTSWTDGLQRFTGVRASLLLAPVAGQGTRVQAVALNDYKSSMALRDLTDYPVIIAYKRNGQYMPIRDKGPLWIIFPQDDHPELRGLETDQKMAWQLRRLIVQ